MIVAGVVVSGLVLGSLAGLNTLGLVLLWRSTRLINLAQPSLGLVGGVLTGVLVQALGWSFWLAAPTGMLAGALLGVATDRFIMRRLRNAPRAVLLVATVGLAGLLAGIQTALPFIFTGRTLPTYSVDFGVSFDIGVEHVSGPKLLVLILFPCATVLTWWLLHRSRFGLAAVALGQNEERARSLGVPASLVRSIVWAVAGVLSAISGILAIPIQGFSLAGGLGPTVLLLALAPAIFASLRNIYGAALAALGVGIAFELVHFYVSRSNVSELLFGGAMLAAIALQGRRIGRDETALRASSWDAAVTVRPLPWSVTGLTSFRRATVVAIGALIAVAAAAPVLLSPAHRVLYATSAALAIGALSVAVIWMFSGEVALGQWGIAGLGAATAASMPGPWIIRALIAAIAMSGLGAALAMITRRRSNLSFAVIGLVIASAAPVALQGFGRQSISAGTFLIGAVAAAVAVAAAAVIALLRSSRAGSRMVAARDEPGRAATFGARPLRQRAVAHAIAGLLAGFAGALYLAATPAGLAPGAFDAARSLDVLSIAVIGGLGSPAGAIGSVAIVQLLRFALPEPWRSLTSGAGVLLVVILRPSGLSGLLSAVRNAFVLLVTGRRIDGVAEKRAA